jgi:hypothetical protein
MGFFACLCLIFFEAGNFRVLLRVDRSLSHEYDAGRSRMPHNGGAILLQQVDGYISDLGEILAMRHSFRAARSSQPRNSLQYHLYQSSINSLIS